MQLLDVTKKTENLFFHCLQREGSVDTDVLNIRRQWFEKFKAKGHRARLLVLDHGQIVGLVQYLPIEYSFLVGENLMVILCLWVHGYENHIGVHQGQGYGRFIVDAVEEETRALGLSGVAAWGMDWDINWMPASFFEHLGYSRVDQEDKVIVLWKPFSPDVQPPLLKRLDFPLTAGTDKVNVTVVANGWCLGCQKIIESRNAIKGLEDIVEYEEIDPPDSATYIHLGNVGGIFLDGKPFKPYEPPGDSDELQAEILRLYEQKGK